MIPTTAEAVGASVAVAARLGLACDAPSIVAEGYSVRVRLDPTPVLTRVVTLGRLLRGEPRTWMQREVEVSRYLAARGAPVVPPWGAPGPYQEDGLDVTLWTWLEPEAGEVPPHDFGPMLKDLHDSLAGYDADLPLLVGPLTDIASALAVSSDQVLHEAAAVLVPLAHSWPRRPLHGDAHTGNMLMTQAGPKWMDFEDVCVGPVEWDLASRTLSDDYVNAYPAAIDRDRLDDCRSLRRLQILAGILTDDLQDPDLYEEVIEQLRPYRR